MSESERLRLSRANTVINATSKEQEKEVIKALQSVVASLYEKFGSQIVVEHEKKWLLSDIVTGLRIAFPDVKFHHHFDSSSMNPDGGVLFLRAKKGDKAAFPILIAEVKNQGTNDRRAEEGLGKQAKGNAIERLGKNVIGLRAALLNESIFPFVCFGYGCDFEPDSSILDRVSTIAMFGPLNEIHLHNEQGGKFNRGSFFFRGKRWTVDEMHNVMFQIAERSVQYYFSKYGESQFR